MSFKKRKRDEDAENSNEDLRKTMVAKSPPFSLYDVWYLVGIMSKGESSMHCLDLSRPSSIESEWNLDLEFSISNPNQKQFESKLIQSEFKDTRLNSIQRSKILNYIP